MPNQNDKNLGYAAAALRTGGARLGEITGEEEPAIAQQNFLAQGFRRLAGAPPPPDRARGEGY